MIVALGVLQFGEAKERMNRLATAAKGERGFQWGRGFEFHVL